MSEIDYFKTHESELRKARKLRGLSIAQLEAETGIPGSVIDRMEKAKCVPQRKYARILFEFFDRSVPLAAIYDPYYWDIPNAG